MICHKICDKCPRLYEFIQKNKQLYPDFFNGPVPNFGSPDAQFLIVGLAPGLKGANRTGRPFTGDFAGKLLYSTLIKFGWANGEYQANPNDGLQLKNAMITNAVLCVPPENKPTTAEIKTCNAFLQKTIESLPQLKIILCLGRISHQAVIKAFSLRQADFPFAHAAVHHLPNDLYLVDSYHCSLYNTSTKRLTPEMFDDVFKKIGTLFSNFN